MKFKTQIISDVATGTAPFGVASTTAVTNLNADLLDGKHSSDFDKVQIVSFAPTTAGWYRIIDSSGASGGMLRIIGGFDNRVSKIILAYDIAPWGQDGSIQEIQSRVYNSGIINQIRISADGSSRTYVDINIPSVVVPGWITLEFIGDWHSGIVTNPVVGAVVGSTTPRILNIGHGLRTTSQLVSEIATGTAPLVVASTTLVNNLNADMLNGKRADSANTASTLVVRGTGGAINVGSITIADPGVGNYSGFNFLQSSDGAALYTSNYSSDAISYEFALSDNPDSAGDYFSWVYTDWQGTNGMYQPFRIGNFTTTLLGNTHEIKGSISQTTSPFFTTRNSTGVARNEYDTRYGQLSSLKIAGTGSITITNLNVSGYAGAGGAAMFIKIIGTGTTFCWGYGQYNGTPQQTDLAISTSPTILGNGVEITFSSTTGGVAGDAYMFRVWKTPSNTFGASSFSAPITSTVATGTAPLTVTSTTTVTNLNADLLDGNHASAFALASHNQAASTITIADAGSYYAGSEVETALQEVGLQTTKINTILADTNEPTGFLNRTATLAFTAGTRVFTITGAIAYYYKGVKYTKTNDTYTIANTVGTHYLYYDQDQTIKDTLTFPGMSVALIAFIYWNGTQGNLADERHGIIMDAATHTYLHEVNGTQYYSGLTATFTDTTLAVAQGAIRDEDNLHAIADQTTCDVYYKNGSAAWVWNANQTKYYHDSGTQIYYNNGNALATVATNQYVAYWIYATNSITKPIISIMGSRVDTNIDNARANNKYEDLLLGDLPYKEFKILYRVILRGSMTLEEVMDMRSVSAGAGSTYVPTSHDNLTGIQGGGTYHLSSTQYTELTDSGSTDLHTHDEIKNFAIAMSIALS